MCSTHANFMDGNIGASGHPLRFDVDGNYLFGEFNYSCGKFDQTVGKLEQTVGKLEQTVDGRTAKAS